MEKRIVTTLIQIFSSYPTILSQGSRQIWNNERKFYILNPPVHIASHSILFHYFGRPATLVIIRGYFERVWFEQNRKIYNIVLTPTAPPPQTLPRPQGPTSLIGRAWQARVPRWSLIFFVHTRFSLHYLHPFVSNHHPIPFNCRFRLQGALEVTKPGLLVRA